MQCMRRLGGSVMAATVFGARPAGRPTWRGTHQGTVQLPDPA
jgi:hypothetical protein